MRLKIYQVRELEDRRNRMYMNYTWHIHHELPITEDYYKTVWEEEVEMPSQLDIFLEMLFQRFNCNIPEGYKGHSMSVSDCILLEEENNNPRVFFVDRFGFQEVENFYKINC